MKKSCLKGIFIALVLVLTLVGITGCGTENKEKESVATGDSDLKWELANPIYVQDWNHVIVNSASNYATPLIVKINANGTFSYEITNKEKYKKNYEDEEASVKSAVENACANFINNTTSEEKNFDLDNKLEEQFSQEKLLTYLNNRVDEGIKITSATIDEVRLTEESISKINEYKKNFDSYIAYINDGLSQTQIDEIESKIKSITGIYSIRYTSKVDALKNAKEKLKNEGTENADDLLSDYTDTNHPFPASFMVFFVKSYNTNGEIKEAIKGIDGVKQVSQKPIQF